MFTDSLTKTHTSISRTLSCFSRHLSHQNDLITACMYMYINYAYAASYIKQVVKDTCGWYNYHNDLILFVIHRLKQTKRECRSKMNMRNFRWVYILLLRIIFTCIAVSRFICCIFGEFYGIQFFFIKISHVLLNSCPLLINSVLYVL